MLRLELLTKSFCSTVLDRFVIALCFFNKFDKSRVCEFELSMDDEYIVRLYISMPTDFISSCHITSQAQAHP